MLGFIFSLVLLVIALYGYYLGIRQSKSEKEIRKSNLDYECFKCKEKISIDSTNCPKCSFITLYGIRKKKRWIIFPIVGVWIFVLLKLQKTGIF